MNDIFISYNNEDRPRAQMLADALGQQGWSIFWDRTIPIGRTWRETIGKELSEARCVVVLWSKTSIESEWVREEADDAKTRRVLFPVRIDDIQPPLGFRGIQTADLANWGAREPSPAFDRLIADIAALIGSPRSTSSTKQDEGERHARSVGLSVSHDVGAGGHVLSVSVMNQGTHVVRDIEINAIPHHDRWFESTHGPLPMVFAPSAADVDLVYPIVGGWFHARISRLSPNRGYTILKAALKEDDYTRIDFDVFWNDHTGLQRKAHAVVDLHGVFGDVPLKPRKTL